MSFGADVSVLRVNDFAAGEVGTVVPLVVFGMAVVAMGVWVYLNRRSTPRVGWDVERRARVRRLFGLATWLGVVGVAFGVLVMVFVGVGKGLFLVGFVVLVWAVGAMALRLLGQRG